ncbi:MAG: hypothetical protein KDD38_02640, partial [Bdellovibrionales bacterium]|nr:hypothetical protein [Bdellovibrionales bacterium]
MSNGQFIDWGSSDTHLILNPKLPIEQKQTPNSAALPYLPGHLWLASSGVSADSGKNLKLYGLN